MLECTQCKRLSNDGETTCRWCGRDLEGADTATPTEDTAEEYGLPLADDDEPNPPAPPRPVPAPAYGVPRPIPGPGGIGIILVIGVLLAGLAAVVWFVARR